MGKYKHKGTKKEKKFTKKKPSLRRIPENIL